jgi:hypothetical protein
MAFRFTHRFRDARKEDAAQFTEKRLAWRSQVEEFDLAQDFAALGD